VRIRPGEADVPEFALAAAGAVVFALTTWASLAFGYQVFQNTFETDQALGAVPAPSPIDDLRVPARAGDVIDGEPAHPNELLHPAAPTA
jgi:hypothetical protein